MFLIDWRLTLLSLGLLPFFMYLTFRVGKVQPRGPHRDPGVARRDVGGDRGDAVGLGDPAVEDVRPAGGGDRAVRELNRELARLQIRQAMVGRWFFMIIGTIFSITPAFVYWLAGYLAIQGDPTAPTIGDIVAFTTLQSRLFFPLGQLLNVQVEIQGALALFDRIFEYLEMDPEIVDAPDAVALDRSTIRGAVRFRDVSFRYPVAAVPLSPRSADDRGRGRRPRLADGAAERRSRCPRSRSPAVRARATSTSTSSRASSSRWSGRRARARRPRPTSSRGSTTSMPGAVEIDGRDVRSVTLASLGDVIGFVTQETYLFHDTIRANLLYAKPDATDAELEAATRAAAIHERITELPDGYDTVVGERGYKLSGGEKQRIAIARVLLKDPRILILDEATSALDTVSRAADPGRAGAADGGPHDPRDRPPPLDDPARRPDPRLRARPHRRARHPSPSSSPAAASTPGCIASSSSPRTTSPRPRRCLRARSGRYDGPVKLRTVTLVHQRRRNLHREDRDRAHRTSLATCWRRTSTRRRVGRRVARRVHRHGRDLDPREEAPADRPYAIEGRADPARRSTPRS